MNLNSGGGVFPSSPDVRRRGLFTAEDDGISVRPGQRAGLSGVFDVGKEKIGR